jgi:hypothetical protein
VDSTTNSAIYDVHLEAGGYLMGVVAALATKTNKIGVIGGGEGSEITRGHEGYKAGAKSINPNIEIQEVYTGDWNDTTGAYEAAVGMYDSGVDVIWHSGDGIGLGVVQAAVEKDKYVLGNVEDQKSLGPKNVLSGLQYEWGNVLETIFSDIRSGALLSNTGDAKTYWINVDNGGLSMTDLNDVKGYLNDQDKATIKEVYDKLSKKRDHASHREQVTDRKTNCGVPACPCGQAGTPSPDRPVHDRRASHGNLGSGHAGDHKNFQRGPGQRQRGLPPAQGLDPRAAGRKRRRQDHADERALRPLSAGGGERLYQRPGGGHLLAGKGHLPGHRHGAPAFYAGPAAERDGERHAGPQIPAGHSAGHEADGPGAGGPV